MPEEPLIATEAIEDTEAAATEEVTDDSSSTETKTEQTAEEKAAAEKAEAAEAPEGAPEKYEFETPEVFPEDVKLDESIHEAYSDAARELDLPQDKAQKLFDTTMTALHKRAVEEQDAQAVQWKEAQRTDSEYGKEDLGKNLGIAKKALKEFGTEGLSELLLAPGSVGDHPEMVRFLVRVGKAISEDSFVGAGSGKDDIPQTDEARAKVLYPNS